MKRVLGGAIAASLALSLVASTSASAQRAGAIEIGGFGLGTWFEDAYEMKD